MIFFDTNFIVNLLIETEFTEKAKKIVMDFADDDFVTSITVVEETFYVLRRLTSEENRKIVEMVENLVTGLEIHVLEKLPYNEFMDVFGSYSLLPNDALIAATCKHHGIRKIATFDEDFKRIDFLEVVEV